MKMFKLTIFVLALTVIEFAQGQDFVFPDSDTGYFNPANFIPRPQTNYGQQHQQTTNRKVTDSPIVPPYVAQQNRFDERISQTKCIEYSKLVQKKIQFTSLSLSFSTHEFTSNNDCDISTGLIVGGVKANSGEFPHQAAIGFRNNLNQDIQFGCGGSLISENFVLTAAHCRRAGQSPAYLVRLGAIDLTSPYPQDYQIESFIVHEKYKSRTKENDIAVVKLATKVLFSEPQKIRPACLWQSENLGQTTTVATGFGYTQYSGAISNELMKVPIDILSNDLCKKTYEDERLVVDNRQICAGVLSGGRDTCQGDSGGPIQITKSDNKCISYIIGITSYGGYCGGENTPSIYTRVSAYLDWIETKVWR